MEIINKEVIIQHTLIMSKKSNYKEKVMNTIIDFSTIFPDYPQIRILKPKMVYSIIKQKDILTLGNKIGKTK
jgi:hypothetical protein